MLMVSTDYEISISEVEVLPFRTVRMDKHKFTDAVKVEVLRRVSPDLTKGLPSFLPLFTGMKLLLTSKDCVRFGLVKGCLCTLEQVVFAPAEVLPDQIVAGDAHQLRYMPVILLLRAGHAEWTLPESELPEWLAVYHAVHLIRYVDRTQRSPCCSP